MNERALQKARQAASKLTEAKGAHGMNMQATAPTPLPPPPIPPPCSERASTRRRQY